MQTIDTLTTVLTSLHRVSSRVGTGLQRCPGIDGQASLRRIQRAVAQLAPVFGASSGEVKCDLNQVNDMVSALEQGLGVLQNRSALPGAELQLLVEDWDALHRQLLSGLARSAA